MSLTDVERQAEYRARLSERLRIAEDLIESAETSEWKKGNQVSLNNEYDPERKPVFQTIKKFVGIADAPVKASRTLTVETPHRKVFRLVGERRVEEASRLAARLVNSGEADGFFIYGGTEKYRRAEAWFSERVQAGKRGQSSTIEVITPEVAQILLKNNDGNRRVNAGSLSNIIRDIIGGSWELNGETFKVSREGLLNDSQHRNLGVLISGQSIKTYVVFGVQRETMRTVDTGRKRTASDRLALKGEGDYVAYSAISGLSFEITNGRAGSAREIDEYFESNSDDIREAHRIAGSNIRGLGPSVAGAAALHLIRIGAPKDKVQEFFKLVRTGDGGNRTSPRVVYNALNPKQPALPKKMKKTEWVSTLVSHFVEWLSNRPVRQLIEKSPIAESL